MRCKNCGSENEDNLYICQNCGSPLYDEDEPINDSNIKFEKGSDGLYEIGGKKYTLKEAIERL